MESDLLLYRWDFCPRLAADHKAERAVLEFHITGARLGLPAAMITGWLDHDGLARRALAQRRCVAGLALLMRRGCGAAIGVERPFDMVLGQTVSKYGAGMVENHGVGLAVGGAQHAADHLAKQTHLLRRPCENAAADGRAVPALGQHHAVRDDLDFAAG